MTSATVGQRVRTLFGVDTVSGTIVEDRGPLGVGGRRLFMVAIPNDPEDPNIVMRAEDEIEPDTTQVEPLSPDEIQRYLENGGLVSILRQNMSGGKNQPSVWLCRSSLGNVTYTFEEERGLVGGNRVPFFALHGEKIFTPEVPKVVDFVMSFGLSKQRAQAVVAKVGHTSQGNGSSARA